MEAIFEKMTVKRTLAYIDFLFDQRAPDQPLLEMFLNKIVKDKIFTQESLDKLIEEELKKPSESLNNLESVMSRSSLERRNSEFATINILKENNGENPPKGVIEGMTGNNYLKPPTGNQAMLWKGITNSSDKTEMIGNEKIGKDSKAVSELIISSYSVASNYLNDSDTEGNVEQENQLNNSCQKLEETKGEPEQKTNDTEPEQKDIRGGI